MFMPLSQYLILGDDIGIHSNKVLTQFSSYATTTPILKYLFFIICIRIQKCTSHSAKMYEIVWDPSLLQRGTETILHINIPSSEIIHSGQFLNIAKIFFIKFQEAYFILDSVLVQLRIDTGLVIFLSPGKNTKSCVSPRLKA